MHNFPTTGRREKPAAISNRGFGTYVAALVENLVAAIELIPTLEDKKARPREENPQLCERNEHFEQQLAPIHKATPAWGSLSSGIVTPKNSLPKGDKKRKKDRQAGHGQHLRSPFPPKAIDHFQPQTLEYCSDCSGKPAASQSNPELFQ
ncbi:hypothetical protein THTE_1539 [Thermogutta terrifontis]|uniref:Uncharacterized protein n=1 Tax=Thermogutta terrifontis TaxID=1331910 RepID=A0A286RDV0_9BACT|nr:hypothetical protein [Thermogutta terrifontis]ASV74141.1 hypothetical protein THTE_1539 [Thermogutta terrifontis]